MQAFLFLFQFNLLILIILSLILLYPGLLVIKSLNLSLVDLKIAFGTIFFVDNFSLFAFCLDSRFFKYY